MFKVAAKCMEYKKVQNSNETMDANKEKEIYKSSESSSTPIHKHQSLAESLTFRLK